MKDPKTMSRQEALDYIAKIKEGRDPEAVEFANKALAKWPGNKTEAAAWLEINNRAYAPPSDSERRAEQERKKAERSSPAEQAEALWQLGSLKQDKEFLRRYHAGDKHAAECFSSLHRQAYGTEPISLAELNVGAG
jgi:hypothetical protein